MNGTNAMRRSLGGAREGYSLMELVLVVTLLAIITSSIIPVFRGSFGFVHADYTLRDIVALLKYAQERAVTDTTRYRFYMAPEKRQYWLMRQRTQGEERLFEEVTEKKIQRRTLPDGLTMERPKAYEDRDLDAYFIEFHPNGACSVASIELTKDDGASIKIETKGKLGHIEVEEE